MPTCSEPVAMRLVAKPSGTGKDTHLDFGFCLAHGIAARAQGYRDATEELGAGAYDE